MDSNIQKLNMSLELQTELYKKVVPTILHILDDNRLIFKKSSYSPGARKGEAFFGRILQIETNNKKRGTEEDEDVHFMVKFGFNEQLRTIYPLRHGYEREIYIYTEVLPRFEQLQDFSYPFKRYPKYYASKCTEIPEYILLSNMRQNGYRMANRFKSLTTLEMTITVRQYAIFHALSFVLRQTKPSVFAQIVKVTSNHFDLALRDAPTQFPNINLRRAISTLDPIEDEDVLIQFQQLLNEDFHQLMVNATAASAATECAVVCHGDACVTNLMYRTKNEKQGPFEVALLDFQLAKLGSPALDLSQLFFTCTDKAFRDAHYDKLLTEYHSSLIFFAKGLQVDVCMSSVTFREHMKEYSIYGLYKAIANLHLQMCDDSDIPDIENVVPVSNCMQNFDCSSSNAQIYRERMRGVLIDFVRKGYNLHLALKSREVLV